MGSSIVPFYNRSSVRGRSCCSQGILHLKTTHTYFPGHSTRDSRFVERNGYLPRSCDGRKEYLQRWALFLLLISIELMLSATRVSLHSVRIVYTGMKGNYRALILLPTRRSRPFLALGLTSGRLCLLPAPSSTIHKSSL